MLVKNAPLEKLANAIIDLGQVPFISFFIKNVENAPVSQMVGKFVCQNNFNNILRLAKELKGNAQGLLIENMLKLDLSAEKLYTFAKEVKGDYAQMVLDRAKEIEEENEMI